MTKYLKICPRGFANEVTYLRIPAEAEPAAELLIQSFAGRTDGYAEWTEDERARWSGVAVDWADRAHVGIIDV